MTSLYQVIVRKKVVETVTPKNKKVKRWFYLDIRKCLDSEDDREEAVVGVPEDRIIRTDFGREIILDVSTPEKEYAALIDLPGVLRPTRNLRRSRPEGTGFLGPLRR
jgi:hypothetical protein